MVVVVGIELVVLFFGGLIGSLRTTVLFLVLVLGCFAFTVVDLPVNGFGATVDTSLITAGFFSRSSPLATVCVLLGLSLPVSILSEGMDTCFFLPDTGARLAPPSSLILMIRLRMSLACMGSLILPKGLGCVMMAAGRGWGTL